MKKILSAVIATFVSFIVFAEITVNGVVNSGNIISVEDSEEITISGDAMGVVIIVRTNIEANIVIDNLTIDNELSNVPAIQLEMGSSLNLTLKGVNTLYGAENFAALNVPQDTKLVIRGDGILHAESLAGGAGIGGNDGEHCGTVEIESGTISAFGGFEAAGIGGGCDGNGGNITIKGGYVYATALDSGAGIGGGAYGNGGNVVIVGGSVCAEGSFAMGTEDIGKGYGATDSGKLTNGKDNSNKNVYRCGLDKSMAEEEVSSVVVKVIKENEFNYDYKWDGDVIGSELDFYLPEGTFEAYIDGLPYEVAVTKDGYSWKQRMINIKANDVDISEGAGKGWKFASGELLIDGSDVVTLTGANDNVRIVIANGAKANVTISNLSIDGTKAYTSGKSVFSLGRTSHLNLTVLGQNTLTSVSNYAAINVPVNASLTITGDSVGKLTANGGDGASGIGGNYQEGSGKIVILSGNIEAKRGSAIDSPDDTWKDVGKGEGDGRSRGLTNGDVGGNQRLYLVMITNCNEDISFTVTNSNEYVYKYNGQGIEGDAHFYLPAGEYYINEHVVNVDDLGNVNIEFVPPQVSPDGPIAPPPEEPDVDPEEPEEPEVVEGAEEFEGVFIMNVTPQSVGNWVLDGNKLVITNSEPVLIFGESEKISVTVASNVNANVTISNLVLNATNLNAAAIAVSTNATLNLTISGTNNLVGSSNHAGINVPTNATLVVTEQSDGYLRVMGGMYGDGIGGGDEGDVGVINIFGGTIEANGGANGAGIGGGVSSSGGVINIFGGTVIANGGESGAGIGGGYQGDGADVIITGGSVRALGGNGAMDIGKGASGYDSRTLTNGKNGGNQNVRLVKLPKSYGTNLTIHVTNAVPYKYCYDGNGYVDDDNLYFYLPEGESILLSNNKCYQILLDEHGEYSINDISSGVYVNGKEVLYGNLDSVVLENDVLRITDSNPVVISGSSDKFSVSIPKNMTANITASNLFFNVANTNAITLGEYATLNLTIVGDNELGSGENCAGIKVPYNSRLVITEVSTGKMVVRGGENAAGIGGEPKLNAGQVFVYGGYVNAIGGVGGAGIGGGANANGGFVEVVDGFLEALGGTGGAGIGGGASGEGGVVEIEGGSVKAFGGEGAENIGKGRDGEGSGSLTNGEAGKKQNLCLVTYPYSTEVDNGSVEINVTNAQDYVYKFTAPECDIGDTLYFYLPMGEYKQFINGYAYNLAVTNLVETNSIAFVSLGKETGLLVDDVDIAFGECDALKYEGNVISIVTNSEVLLTGFTEDVVIEVPEGVTANLTISNAVLDAYYIESAAIIIRENAKLNLTVLGTNYIYGADGFAGINVPIGAALEVTTNSIGSLYVNGGAHAAGIGGNEEESFGDIVILSGNIKSYGSARAADIGKGEDGGSQGQLTNGSVGGDLELYPVKFPKLDAMVSIAVTNVKSYVYSFDGNGFEEDDYSTIYLPIGEYTVEIADDTYKAIVTGDESADAFIKMSGIYVNGFDAAFNYETNAVFANNELIIKDHSHYLITGSADDVSIYIESNYAYLTVSNLTLNVTNKSPIALGQLANLNLTVLGTNSFTAGEGCAGINTSHGYLYITNESIGSLLAQGGRGAAGIGGNENGDFIEIVINGGNIQAFGGEGAMDIGAGAGVENSAGKLTNGSLGGMQHVYRVTCPFAANGVSVTVTNASEYVYSCNPASTNTTDTMSLYLPNGEYTISIDDREYYAFVNDADTVFEKVVDTWVNGDDILDGEGAGWVLTDEGQLLITNSTPITITGVSSYGIKIAENVSAKLTASNLIVSAGMSAITLAEGASLQLTVLGDNTFVSPAYCAGINVPLNTTLIITQASDGTLSVNGGDFAAGIGGNNNESAGKVEIYSGTIYVAGGSNAAGIGGGAYGSGGVVKIYNGSITVTGGTSGAGIGGGWYGEGGNVDIAGGDVNAIGDTANGAENIGHGASVLVSGTLTSNGQPAMLVQYPYAKQITIIHPSYTYKYSDNGDNSSGTLNFYLPEVQQSKLRMSVGGTKVYVIESDTVYADKVYVADISSGVVQPEDRKDVTSEVVKMAKLDVQSDDATATISCDVADQALIQNVRVSYGESLDMLTTSPEFISPSVSTDGEATTLEVKMPKKSSMGFFSLKLQ